MDKVKIKDVIRIISNLRRKYFNYAALTGDRFEQGEVNGIYNACKYIEDKLKELLDKE